MEKDKAESNAYPGAKISGFIRPSADGPREVKSTTYPRPDPKPAELVAPTAKTFLHDAGAPTVLKGELNLFPVLPDELM